MIIRRKFIREKAEALLRDNRISGPPVAVDHIARTLGLVISKESIDSDLDGFLMRDRKRNIGVIGVNGGRPMVRQRFTIAHELGHVVLHSAEGLHVDRGYEIKLRSQTSSQGTDAEEREANLFAAELLMPASFVEKDIARLGRLDLLEEDSLGKLARQYQVSEQALTFRLINLGYIHI